METIPIAKSIVNKGFDKVDLSMFNEEEKREIYSKAAEIFLRLGKLEDGFIALEKSGKPPIEELMKLAEAKIALEDYAGAYKLLIKIGKKELADFIKKNFIDKS